MKHIITILSIFLFAISVYSQSNIFVLIDVSKSGSRTLKEKDAKAIIEDIVMGSYTQSIYPNWVIINGVISITEPNMKSILSGSGNSLIINNSIIGLIEIGDYGRHLSNKVFSRILPNQDFKSFMSKNYPVNVYKDGCSLIDLPLAWLASYLKSIPLSDYYVFIVSDNKQDTHCQASFTNDDYKLIDDYGKGTIPAIKIATLQGKSENQLMFITIWKINLSGIHIPPNTGTGIIIPPPNSDSLNPIIRIISPLQSKKGKEHEIKSEILNINWTCNNCPSGIKYTVMVSQYDGGKFREIRKYLGENSITLKVPDGKFRITVSASNYATASSDNTYVIVSSGNYGWIIFLFLLIAGGTLGYYFWNKKRQEKIDESAPNITDDIFSNANNKGSSANTTSNSDYF